MSFSPLLQEASSNEDRRQSADFIMKTNKAFEEEKIEIYT